ncbi:MAG: TonB-dependent receptor [Muribaculaceae bacterium]|nr:TonB-dependent receptor [Muribaculaceae bacterium]
MRKHSALITAALSITASAQSVGAENLSHMSADTTRLAEVSVVGVGRKTDIKSAVPVHTLNRKKIATQGISDISEALRRLPGVNLRDYGGAGGMKTVSVRGLGSQHTGVAYDGVPLSDIQSGQIDLSRYSIDNIEALNITVGDNDNIFTPARTQISATTLNIAVNRPAAVIESPFILYGKVRVGSFGLISPSFRTSVGNGCNLGMNLNGDFIHADNNYPFTIRNGQHEEREKRHNSGINSGHLEWNGVWKPTATSFLSSKIYTYLSDRHLPGPVVYYNPESNEDLKESNIFGQFIYRLEANEKWSVSALAKYSFSRTHYTDRNAIYPGGLLDNLYRQAEEYASASILYRPIYSLQISYSSDLWHNSLRSNAADDSAPFRNSFLQSVSLKWTNARLTIIGRGLFSIISDRSRQSDGSKNFNRLSPSFSLSYRILKDANLNIRASYKEIMRMPTFSELYFDHYGSISLKPENTRQFNVGTTFATNAGSLLEEISFIADVYYNLISNKIVAMPYNMFLMTMTNLGKVHAVGSDIALSLGFRVHPQHRLDFNLSYSYQRAASRTERNMSDWNKQLPYTPLNSGGGALSWLNPWLNVALHATAASGRYSTTLNIPSTRIGGYVDCGLALFREFRFGKTKLEGRIEANNLLDKTYELVGRYPMPGRNFSASISLNL